MTRKIYSDYNQYVAGGATSTLHTGAGRILAIVITAVTTSAVTVTLYDNTGCAGNNFGGTSTNANGDYSFYGLDTDGRSYRVRVNGPPRGYDFELFNDKPCPGNGCDR